MIDVKELRIGNYVFSNMAEDEIQISALIESMELAVEPIELTEEWLVRIGFENLLDIKEIYHIGELKGQYLQVILNDGKFVCRLAGKTLRIVKYVHTLQNLFHSLYEEELTIKK